MSDFHIAVIGNPNCGKTTFFNALTGAQQRVGNWPGVTVDRKQGFYDYNEKKIEIIDLPGIYALSGIGKTSLDEKVARDYILSKDSDLIVNVIDASNLQRNLYLTMQLLEMRTPLIIVLNMSDVAQKRGITIDVNALSKELGCPVIPVIATQKKGLGEFMDAVEQSSINNVLPNAPTYQKDIENALTSILPISESIASQHDVNKRWLSIRLLEGDGKYLTLLSDEAKNELASITQQLENRANEDTDILIADSRYTLIHKLVGNILVRKKDDCSTLSDKIDCFILNRFAGIPFFMFIMYLLFLITINFSSAFISFFDILTGTIFVDGSAHILSLLNAPEWITVLISKGVGGGIQTVSTFIPVIGFLFLFLTFLEDSGYMSRAAFVMDRTMRTIGLPGKSFVPMILGFGCTVPAVMAARTLDNQRDRIMTSMMAPFMSCGARLPVYALFAAAFFPHGGQNIIFLLYILGIVFAVLTGLILKHTLLKGESEPFIMELPSYHMPTIRSLFLRTWHRLHTFIFSAGKMVVVVVVMLSFLNSYGTDGTFKNENTSKSVLSYIGKSLTPIVEPMGIDKENWPATVGLFTGIFAKEVIVGTLDALYSQIDAVSVDTTNDDSKKYNIWSGISDAFATVGPGLVSAAKSFSDPLGLNINDNEGLASNQSLSTNTFGTMVKYFNGNASALAYLMMILLYMPCVAASATIMRETSVLWASFIALWSTGLGYSAAVITFQLGTFSQHPQSSSLWCVAITAVFILTIIMLRRLGQSSKYSINAAEALKDSKYDSVRY